MVQTDGIAHRAPEAPFAAGSAASEHRPTLRDTPGCATSHFSHAHGEARLLIFRYHTP